MATTTERRSGVERRTRNVVREWIGDATICALLAFNIGLEVRGNRATAETVARLENTVRDQQREVATLRETVARLEGARGAQPRP